MLISRSQLISTGHRQLLVAAGLQDQSVTSFAKQVSFSVPGKSRLLWLGTACPIPEFRTVNRQQVHRELGSESHVVVINALDFFDADATAALAGTLLPGGMLYLITPPLQNWPTKSQPFTDQSQGATHPSDNCPESRYVRRLCQQIYRLTEKVSALESNNQRYHDAEFRQLIYTPKDYPTVDPDKKTTAEQLELISDVKQMAQSNSAMSLFVTADRGRGKSAALGIAAARLIEEKPQPVAIIAPTRRAVDVLHRHFREQLSDQNLEPLLYFLAPDQLKNLSDSTQLIMVDEAAGIPVRLLMNIHLKGKPTVYSSTVNGYEGAGRGFAIRFTQSLSKSSLPVRFKQLHEPIRWAVNDPLEIFCNSVLMLSDSDNRYLQQNEYPDYSSSTINQTLSISELSQDELASDESLLADVFGVLLQAHYRTCPHDLWHLMDGQNLRIFVAFLDKQVIAATLVATEGPILEPRLRHGIMMKTRRPKGHVLPQLLAQYTMSANPLDMKIARVVRIAVVPGLQRRGIGSLLLQRLPTFYRDNRVDAIGAMFGGAPETIRFWHRAGYRCVHLSAGTQTSIGYPSVCMLTSFSERAQRVQTVAAALHYDNTAHRQKNRNIESDSGLPRHNYLATTVYDTIVLARYINGSRSLSDSRVAINRIIEKNREKLDVQAPLEGAYLTVIHEFQQDPNISMSDLATKIDATGKKAAEKLFKTSLLLLLQENGSDKISGD